MIVKIAIQCTDKRTKQIGDFGYRTNFLYSVTPIFDSLEKLYRYLDKNKIKYSYNAWDCGEVK